MAHNRTNEEYLMKEESLMKIQKIFDGKSKFEIGDMLDVEEIDYAVSLLNESLEKKDFITINLAEHIMKTGSLNDLSKAKELIMFANNSPYGRNSVLLGLCERFLLAENDLTVESLISLMESDAIAMEKDFNEYHSSRAQVWIQVANLYSKIGNLTKADYAQKKATEIAISGQLVAGAHDGVECRTIIGEIIERYLIQGKYELAIQAAQAWTWHHKDLWIKALTILQNAGQNH